MTDRKVDQMISDWLEAEARKQVSDSVLRATFERTRNAKQQVGWRVLLGRLSMPRFLPALAGAAIVLVVGAVALGVYFNGSGVGVKPSPSPTMVQSPPPSIDVASFEPVVGRIFCRNPSPKPYTGTILGCSRDGTRVLIQKGDENLFILQADGSETQVTEQLSGISRLPGSARPAGATISPDGSRVVFAGLTKTAEEARSCHDGALFAVDADGGPAELLFESQVEANGIVRYPTFSPDGTRIAFADGYCDHDHSVWVMNADGSDAHQIVANETTLGAGHVVGLAWSAAGDRIALSIDYAGTFTFAPDGSGFTQDAATSEFCWLGRQC
jgi:hypothetical protein